MRWDDLKRLFNAQKRVFAAAGYPDCRRTVLRKDPFPRHRARDCCISITDLSGEDPPEVHFHPDVYPRLDEAQCLALTIHELAHVADPDLSEAATDALAESVTGIPIFYGPDDVQTTAGGVRPRPRRLPR